MKTNETNQEANSFAEMFENSLASMDKLKPGQPVKTVIVSISGDTVFLELSGKSEGVLDRAELTDDKGLLTVEEGDEITAYYLDSKGGVPRFTTKIAGDSAKNEMLENAFANGIPVEGAVEKEIKGGFEVKIGGARAFCPFSQMGEKRGDQSESPVGKRLTFKILEYKQGGRSILVSNRAIVEEERAKQREAQKATLEEGMIVKGTVKSLQKFGAFVEINGLQGLLPISEIARERINEVGDVLAVGQEVEVQIIRLDWQNDRITLSLKSLLADPWESVAEKYAKGTKHEGTVSRVAAFGAFVTLESGIDGLLHVSEISGGVQHGEAKNEVKPGQKISVVIKDVDVKNRKISLRTVSSFEQDKAAQSYMNGKDDGETYNPFASLLKKK